MKNIDSYTHTRGESIYIDDIPLVSGTLFGAVYGSPVAHAKITSLDLTAAASLPGVVRIFTYKDIPGRNQIGGIVPDEPLLAEHEVHFNGMPVAFVVASTEAIAHAAAKLINISTEPLTVITDPRVAQKAGSLIVPPRTFKLGDSQEAFGKCDHIFEGTAETNGQEHLYIETQGAYALPLENNAIRVYSSTQGPTAVQRHMAAVLDIPMHRLEIDVIRLGGGFGGKEDQATPWAIFCALATYHLKKPVKYCLNRIEDMRMTGKRNPYSSDFKIGLDKDLKIIAYEATFYQNAGAAADLSPAVLERTLFHCTNSYFVPNVTARAYSCRTNLPPNTAFRGFGGPQGMFVIESAIATAAEKLGIPASIIQKKNLLETGDVFPFGQPAKSEALACWTKAEAMYDTAASQKAIQDFNQLNAYYKKGIAFMPVCFGISFTKTPMNQARALVHVYMDGSINISTGAVEMGQGVNTKMLQVASHVFSVESKRVTVNSTNTYRIINTSPSAASSTADLNGKAVQIACDTILQRLKISAAEILKCETEGIVLQNEKVWVYGKETELKWNELVLATYLKRINLSEHGHYATPDIHFDYATEKGHPFAYHVYGTAVTEVTIDCIRGIYIVDKVEMVHDFGTSMNPIVDRGQIEGGLVQGIGWMTMEEIVFDENGTLRSNALSTYKIPDIYSVPKKVALHFLETDSDNPAILRSKAVGEPPLMYGLGTFFALRNAIKAFNPNSDIGFSAPMTPEKVLIGLYTKKLEVQSIYSKRCWYREALVPATVLIKDGKIMDVIPGKEEGAFDAGDNILMPGVIDAHVHVNEPGRTEWEGFETATRAAAKGGITTIIDMPLNADPVTTSVAALQEKIMSTGEKLTVNCGFYGGLVPGNINQLEPLFEKGVMGIKCFLTHSGIDEFPNVIEKDLHEAMPLLAKHGIILLAHCELLNKMDGKVADDTGSYMAYMRSRPDASEVRAINFMIDLCRKHQCPIHIVHVSSAASIQLIEEAKAEGLPVTAETCAHYIFFNAENIPDHKTIYKCAPPIRELHNNQQLIKALCNGVLDFLTSDHSPAPPDIKEIASGNIMKAWGGIAGLQFLLPTSWTACRDTMKIEQFIPLLTSKPAAFLKLDKRKGKIDKGYDADLIIWDPAEAFTVQEKDIEHRHKISPYIGCDLFGVVKQTIVNGQLVYDKNAKHIRVLAGDVILNNYK